MKIKKLSNYQHLDSAEMFTAINVVPGYNTECDVFIPTVIYQNQKTGGVYVMPEDVFIARHVEIEDTVNVQLNMPSS